MQTVRQAFTILKQNPLLSTISILGTAFAITMIAFYNIQIISVIQTTTQCVCFIVLADKFCIR